MAALAGARRELMDRFDQRSQRERLLLLAAVLSLMVLAWDSLLMTPLARQHASHVLELEQLTAEVSGLESSLRAPTRSAEEQAALAQRDQLRAEVAALNARLDGATSGLIEPRDMARVLRDLLAHASALELRTLRSLPPEPLLAAPGGAAAAPDAPAAQIFKHGLELELAGGYLDALRLLQELEALPWRFFWDRAEFKVEQHPRGSVRVRLYTLGLTEGWLGV